MIESPAMQKSQPCSQIPFSPFFAFSERPRVVEESKVRWLLLLGEFVALLSVKYACAISECPSLGREGTGGCGVRTKGGTGVVRCASWSHCVRRAHGALLVALCV